MREVKRSQGSGEWSAEVTINAEISSSVSWYLKDPKGHFIFQDDKNYTDEVGTTIVETFISNTPR